MSSPYANLVIDNSLQAQADLELQGLTTFAIPGIAYFTLQVVDRSIYVRTFFVVESMRRQGIGTRLFRDLERHARDAGFVLLGISIDSTRKDPAGALAFAKSVGLRVSDSGSGPGHIAVSKALLRAVPAGAESSEAQA